MTEIHGKGISCGIVFGRISIYKRKKIKITASPAADTAAELERLRIAKEKTGRQLDELYAFAAKSVGDEDAQIFEIHKMLLEDPDYVESIEKYIIEDKFSAEYAVSLTASFFDNIFAAVEDEYMRGRSADMRDVSERLIGNLAGIDLSGDLPETASVIFADDIAPSEIIRLDKSKVTAFCTVLGSASSHTAILARNMNIPAVAGIGSLNDSINGKEVIADGTTGIIYIDPDNDTRSEMLRRRCYEHNEQELIKALEGKGNTTLDGYSIEVTADIHSPREADAAFARGADGIGLFRSDELFRNGRMSEEEQFRIYRDILEKAHGKPVIIRISDLCADMRIAYPETEAGENAELGFRSTEVSLVNPELLKIQIRALLRASVYGSLGILFPLIVSLEEVDVIKCVLNDVGDELRENNITIRDNIRIGAALDNPAAVFMSDVISGEVDFFSVGLYELAMNTLAADRRTFRGGNAADVRHPAVLRMIRLASENAHKNNADIYINGDPVGSPVLTSAFLALGIDAISVSVPQILPMRKKISEMRVGSGKEILSGLEF